MKNEKINEKQGTLIGFGILLLVSIIDFIFKVNAGTLFTRPLSLLASLFLGFSSAREMIKVTNRQRAWHKVWVCALVVVCIGYGIILLMYGTLLPRILVFLAPLYVSWIGIKKLRNKKDDEADEPVEASGQGAR